MSQEFKVLLPQVDPEGQTGSLEKGACFGSNASHLENSLIKWFLALFEAELHLGMVSLPLIRFCVCMLQVSFKYC